jgi:anti-anti-sigma factor
VGQTARRLAVRTVVHKEPRVREVSMSVAERSWPPMDNVSALGVASEIPLRLELRDVVCADRHTLVLSGEVDIASVAALDAALTRICTERTDAVVLDLRRVSFMDSAGIHAILCADQLCRELDACWFGLIPSHEGQVRRILELTGLLGHSSSGAATSMPAPIRRGTTASRAIPGGLAAQTPRSRCEPCISPPASPSEASIETLESELTSYQRTPAGQTRETASALPGSRR